MRAVRTGVIWRIVVDHRGNTAEQREGEQSSEPTEAGEAQRQRLAERPWLSSYASGVPADIDEVTETLVDLLDTSVEALR